MRRGIRRAFESTLSRAISFGANGADFVRTYSTALPGPAGTPRCGVANIPLPAQGFCLQDGGVFSARRRFISTQSNGLAFIPFNNLQGRKDFQRRTTLENIYRIIERNFLIVNDVAKIPTDNDRAACDGCEGDVKSVVYVFGRNNGGDEVRLAQSQGFSGHCNHIGLDTKLCK